MSDYKKYIISLIVNIVLIMIVLAVFSYSTAKKDELETMKSEQSNRAIIQKTVKKFVKYAFARDEKNYERNLKELKPFLTTELYDRFFEEDYIQGEKATIVSNSIYECTEKKSENSRTYISPVSVHYKYKDNDFGILTTIWKITCSLDNNGNPHITSVETVEPSQKTDSNFSE